SSRRRHTRFSRDWSSDVCSSDLVDRQEDMAREHSLTIDRAGFESEMEQQRERARASWKGAEKGAVVPAYQKLIEQGRTKFLGYRSEERRVGKECRAMWWADGGMR